MDTATAVSNPPKRYLKRRSTVGAPNVSRAEPASDPRSFRRCLGMFATGVTVVTAQAGEERVGLTANSFTSLSLDPPLILWSINRASRNYPQFREARHFAVNILGAGQIEVSQCFAGVEPDKFARAKWRPGSDGAPLLEGAVVHLECSTESQYDGGDHMIIVGRVRRYSHFEGSGLLFAEGRYGIAEDHPDVTRVRRAPTTESGQVMHDSPTLRLLFQALHYMYDEFERRHVADRLTIPQIRVLRSLYDEPKLSLQQVAECAYLGPRDAEDAVLELVETGKVARADGGSFELTPSGRARREALRQEVRDFEKALFADIPEAELKGARSFLERLIAKQSS